MAEVLIAPRSRLHEILDRTPAYRDHSLARLPSPVAYCEFPAATFQGKIMKVRILVMNGQRLVQVEHGTEWTTERVEAANGIKPGIYNIHSAVQADKGKLHEGLVIFADTEHVYQKVGSALVKHLLDDFEKAPQIGDNTVVRYDSVKATAAKSSIKHGRRIS